MTARIYYGWVLAAALGVTATVSWGTLYYAFPVFIVPMGEDLGWSTTAITGVLSVATIVAGFASVPVGNWIDRHGSRTVMTTGSIMATITLLLWSRVYTLEGFYGLAVLLGICQAMLFYEPAFAVIANWFVRYRARALTVLTFIGGFASVVFVPVTAVLVAATDWRTALMWLGIAVAIVTIPVHALVVRRNPEDLGLLPDGMAGGGQPSAGIPDPNPPAGVPFDQAVRSPSFAWLSIAFGLSAFATTGVTVHLIPLLIQRGHPPEFAAMALGALGLVALPGRLILTPLGDVWSSATVAAVIFGLQAIGVGLLLGGNSTPAVWAFVALFGIGFGAISPARAAMVAEYYGRVNYASIAGRLALVLALARASAPVGLSVVHSMGGYQLALPVLLATCAAAGSTVMLAHVRPKT